MSIEEQLEQAKANIARIRSDFKDNPDLLAVYEPSALYLVDLLENQVRKKEYQKEWRKNNPDKVKAQQKKWNADNKEIRRQYHLKRSTAEYRADLANRAKLRRKAHPMTEEQRWERKAKQAEYYKANRERLIREQRERRLLKKKEEANVHP